MKKVFMLIFAVLTITLTLSACGGSSRSMNGTWVRAEGYTGGFESIIFSKGNTIDIPGVTMDAMEVSYLYIISGRELIIFTNGGDVPTLALRFGYRRDGNSIFVDDVEYIRE